MVQEHLFGQMIASIQANLRKIKKKDKVQWNGKQVRNIQVNSKMDFSMVKVNGLIKKGNKNMESGTMDK